MYKKRFLAIMISILGILVLTGTSPAKENREVAPDRVTPGISEHIPKLKEIVDEKIVIDDNAPMKVAVDNYILKKKAEGEAQIAAEQEAKKQAEEDTKRANATASLGQSNSNTKTDQAKTGIRSDVRSEQAQADQILASLIAINPILQGTTVYVRDCPHNWQGCAYYKSAIIWIDPDHKAPLEKIMVHECNHIIDWRTDGDIDHNDYHE